jgi:hypothetical protein
MPIALKAYVPSLARILGLPAATVYERQRSLVRAGLLDIGDGWGPGSGVRVGRLATTANTVAFLVVSTLASETIAAAGSRARDIAEAKPVNANRCPLTGTTTFLDALARILTSGPLPHRVTEIVVSRTGARASIVYRDRGSRARRVSEFAGPGEEPSLRVAASLTTKALVAIRDDVTGMLNEKFEELIERERAQMIEPKEWAEDTQ